MNVASLELCKELYELSGWESDAINPDLEHCWVESKKGWKCELTYVFDNYGQGKQWGVVPAYDLGYLLRKLPAKLNSAYLKLVSFEETRYAPTNRFGWLCFYSGSSPQAKADTPEDAACKLAIELFKQGILKQASQGQKAGKDE